MSANGFALMGASRDLTISVFVEVGLVLAVAVPALIAGTTDLPAMVAATAGAQRLVESRRSRSPRVAFALVVVAETGRQPVDNPDTHLELTMIHEGPLLEYAGRDLALPAVGRRRPALARARARRPGLPPPPETILAGSSRPLPSSLVALCAGLALTETLVAKMRILLVPRLIGVGAAVALLGIVTWLVGNA